MPCWWLCPDWLSGARLMRARITFPTYSRCQRPTSRHEGSAWPTAWIGEKQDDGLVSGAQSIQGNGLTIEASQGKGRSRRPNGESNLRLTSATGDVGCRQQPSVLPEPDAQEQPSRWRIIASKSHPAPSTRATKSTPIMTSRRCASARSPNPATALKPGLLQPNTTMNPATAASSSLRTA